jgi:hypothetical protein
VNKSSLGVGLLIGTLVGVIGGTIGGSVDPVPETKFIKVTPPTEVIVRHETDTKYVVTPMPDSCASIVKNISEVTDQINTWNNRAHDYYVQLEDVDLNALTDQQANNRLVIRTHDILVNEKEAVRSILALEESITNGAGMCKADVEAAESRD